MKIYKIDILKLCNFSHPGFGQFASFLNGLSKDDFIEVPHKSDGGACASCGQKCLHCLELRDGNALKKISTSPTFDNA